MGQQMPLKIVLGLALATVALVAYGVSTPDPSSALIAGTSDIQTTNRVEVAAAEGQAGRAVMAEPLQECALAHVSVAPTPLPPGSVDQPRAERAAGNIGAKSPAAIAIPALVTIGERWGQPPTPEAVLKDAHGQPVLSRAAWTLIFRGQSIQPPSSGPARPKLVATWPTRELPPVTVFAAIVDAATGEFLMGWGCNQPH
jgi:hypothetical protein